MSTWSPRRWGDEDHFRHILRVSPRNTERKAAAERLTHQNHRGEFELRQQLVHQIDFVLIGQPTPAGPAVARPIDRNQV